MKKKQPTSINNWKLDKRNLKIVKREINRWLQLFITQAEGMTGNVYRANFIEDDFFYFTDCRKIVSKEIESKGVEDNLKIRRRKNKVLLQLLMRTMLGETFYKEYHCTHCGHVGETIIAGFSDGGGHFTFCPKCGKTDICTYPEFYDTCIKNIKKALGVKENEKNIL